MIDPAAVPELAGLGEAEEFFAALAVPFDERVLDAHRLQILKAFALALGSWLAANPTAEGAGRLRAAARALRQAHDVFAEGARGMERPNPFAARLVSIGKRG